jgi:hypothetical protein
MLAEHRRLDDLLQKVRDSIVATGETGRLPMADVVPMLRSVREELERHFAEEEEGGCLDEAVSRLPKLAAEANRIETEHPDLLRQLDALIKTASDRETHAPDALEEPFRKLHQQLRRHEAAENKLLKEGLGVGADTGGVS